MSQHDGSDDLDTLAAQAGDKVRKERERFHASGDRKARTDGLAKPAAAAAMLAVLAAVAVVQVPKFSEPFAVLDSDSTMVAEADLTAIGDMVYLFMVAQGRVPATLDDVNLPGGLRALSKQPGLRYTPGDTSYKLVYVLPQRQVEFDGATARLSVTNVPR